MKVILVPALLILLAQPAAAIVHRKTLAVPEVGTITYGISIPDDYDPAQPRPLVLSLHPGEFAPYYGTRFMMGIVLPGLVDLHAIIVAPDCPARSWADPKAERAAMALLQNVLGTYTIDRHRILVTGYSMGGHGTWFMEAQHPDVFTGAIVMAGSPKDQPLDRLGVIPTYVIHSRDDERVPFAPAEQTTRDLEKLGRVVRFEALAGLKHADMAGYVEPLKRAERWIVEAWEK